jgi:hypothetical protein
MIKHVGYPKCMSNDPFVCVDSPVEERAWLAANPEAAKKIAEAKKKAEAAKKASK